MSVSAPRSETSKLRRELGRVDTILFLIAAIVILDTLGAVAVGGGQALTWLAVATLTFFVPAALVVSELGTAFPDEGGPYVWTRLAFGRLAGSLTAFAYWLDAPAWLGGALAITAVTVIDELVVTLSGPWPYLIAFGFVWTGIAFAAAPLRRGKLVPASGAITQTALLAFFTVSVVVYAAEHGVHGIELGDFAPTLPVFLAVAPVLVYNLIGFEQLSAAGGEIRHPKRDVPVAIRRAGILTFVLYSVPLLAILVVLPQQEVTSLRGFIDSISAVLTLYGGDVAPDGSVELAGAGAVLGGIVAVAFVWALLANGLTWIMGATRSTAVACLDGSGPTCLGRISARTGTPVAATLAAGVIASAVTGFAFLASRNDEQKYFSIVLTLSIVLLACANLAVFPALVRLRRTHPGVARPFRVPGGRTGAAIASGLATCWVLLAIVAALWPGIGQANPDAALPAGFEGRRLEFTLTELVPLAVFLGLGLLFFALGTRRRTALTAEAAGSAPVNP